MKPLSVLYEDNHLLVVNKPCGIATMGTRTDETSLALMAADYLTRKYHKPGKAFVGVVSRLDAFASGVLVFARTSKAASRLSEQIRQRSTSKRYLVCVEADVPVSDSYLQIEDYLFKNEEAHRIQTVRSYQVGTQLAQLRYRCLQRSSQYSILEVDLLTGRKHQIRVQLATRGMTVFADTKYGSKLKWPNSIGLHCYRNVIVHPTQKTSMSFQCMPSHWIEKLGTVAYQEMLYRLRDSQVLEEFE